jgi:ABC-type polysaccharide/polyol phosphate export permease
MVVPWRDVRNVVPHLTRIWLYLSPVLWPLSVLDGRDAWIRTAFELNPMYAYLSLYRTALLGRPLEGGLLFAATVWAVVMLGVGAIRFVRAEEQMGRYL